MCDLAFLHDAKLQFLALFVYKKLQKFAHKWVQVLLYENSKFEYTRARKGYNMGGYMEIRGVYFHSPGNGSSGGTCLSGVVAWHVGDTVRIEDLQGVKIPDYDANPANLDDFILDWEDFAEEVVGEMRQGP